MIEVHVENISRMDIVKQILDAARVVDVMEETDESMEVSGDLSEHSGTLHATGSQTGHNTLESSENLIKRAEAHPTLISQDTHVNSVPIDDGMKAFMGDGDELQNQSYMSSELQAETFKVPWKPDVSCGSHGEGYQTQENQYGGESTFGNFLTVLVIANPPPSHLQNLEHEGYLGASTLSFSMEAPGEDEVPKTPISQNDEETASPTEKLIGNQYTGANAEQIPEKRTPSIPGVRAEPMEASEEKGNDADGLPDLTDKEERRKVKNRWASGKSRENTKMRNDYLLSEMNKLDEEIEPLEQQYRMLHEIYANENAKAAKRHHDEVISIGNYLEIYVMPLVLKYSPGNKTQEKIPVLIAEELNEEEEKLEVPYVGPAPIRHASHRRPRSKNVKTINDKRSNKDASKRYRDQEHIYWKAVEERIEMLKIKLNVLKRKIKYFKVCEGKRYSRNELRKSFLRRQYVVSGVTYDKFTKFQIAGWFYSVGLTEEELCSLYEVDKYLTLPSSLGFFTFNVSSRPDENIIVVDFSPHPPRVSDVAPY